MSFTSSVAGPAVPVTEHAKMLPSVVLQPLMSEPSHQLDIYSNGYLYLRIVTIENKKKSYLKKTVRNQNYETFELHCDSFSDVAHSKVSENDC